jgi:hypothetical protein
VLRADALTSVRASWFGKDPTKQSERPFPIQNGLSYGFKNDGPRHARGDVRHDGAAGELFVKGGMGESAGGYSIYILKVVIGL